MIADGADIGRFLAELHDRAWLNGFGWHGIAAGGKLLERSIIDKLVGSPERLVFEGKPVLGPLLEQDQEARMPVAVDGAALDTATACPPLNDAEVSRLRELKADSMRQLASEANQARLEFVEKKAAEISKRTNKPITEARRIADEWAGGVLSREVELPFDDRKFAGCTVGDVLADPERFDGATMADVMEGVGYGPCKAKILRRYGELCIASHAHGGCLYTLEGAKPNAADEFDFVELLESPPTQPAEAACDVAHNTLGERDVGEDDELWGHIPPREWLLGNVFCRGFLSSLLADGGTGKTALRIAQLISLAVGRPLTGEHVFQRCRVLIVSLEDGERELRRRIRATCIHHGITRDELNGWLFVVSLKASDGKLMVLDAARRPKPGPLLAKLENTVAARRIDVVSIDPFVKVHAVEENHNTAIDEVAQTLTDLADRFHVAVDTPHHVSKGTADPGNANRGRGASSMKDAARLVYTLTAMTETDARAFRISEAERRSLIRMDSAKVNIAPPMTDAKWFRLVGVRLGNATATYPKGDSVQTVEPWKPADAFEDLSDDEQNDALNQIAAGLPDGNRYSSHHNAINRAAWKVVADRCLKTEVQAKQIIKVWVETGLLREEPYDDPKSRKEAFGLVVDDSKRPGSKI